MLGRETPVYILQHLILSFGGSYVLQEELDEEQSQMKQVTHICIDRTIAAQDKSKEYVVP